MTIYMKLKNPASLINSTMQASGNSTLQDTYKKDQHLSITLNMQSNDS